MGNSIRNEERLVAKFGGSSLASPEKIHRAVLSVVEEHRRGSQIAIVVSAMGKTTDNLLNLAKVASDGSISGRDQDSILSIGERLSAKVFAASLRSQGIQTCVLDPAEDAWPILTDESFTNASLLLNDSLHLIQENVLPLVEKGVVPIVPGFIGKSKNGALTTLGRGGSDITAFLLARGLEAKKVLLVSDVDGILSADPKLIERPEKVDRISVVRLAGLSDSGTKFIHSKALRYKQEDIDVYLVNSSRGDLRANGTLIHGSLPNLEVVLEEEEPVLSITFVGEQITAHPETILEILREIGSSGVRICGMSGNHNSIILYLSSMTKLDVLNVLHNIVKSHPETIAMAVRKNLAFLQIRGLGLEETPGIIERISVPLREEGINIFGILTVTSSVDLFVDWDDRERAIKLIDSDLLEDKN